MGDFLLLAAMVAGVAGLLWLQANRHNPNALSIRKPTNTQGALVATKWALLSAAGLMGAIFAYNIFSPISTILGVVVAAMVIGFNFGEGYLIRFAIAGYRYGFKMLALMSILGVLVIAGYSLTAGASVINTLLAKNQDSKQQKPMY